MAPSHPALPSTAMSGGPSARLHPPCNFSARRYVMALLFSLGFDMDSASRRDFLKQLSAGVGLTAAFGPLAGAKRTYTNPVYAGSMPDPGVLLHQGVYYAFGTTGRERKGDGRIFTLLRSTNLVEWQELGGALTPPDADERYEY
ncbi:MAG TPA: twin-arginine translocation signal domain-containing protein, partial [Gemmatimonadaceae bacterium]|nr:twin-arginine translocation signal domain-containing protein [Gemmatimonadaceae bacterium]